MMNNLLKLAVLRLLAVISGAAAMADPVLPTFNDATVWANPPAVATSSTENVTVGATSNLLLPTAQPGDWSFGIKDPALDKISIDDNAVKVQVGKSDGTDWHYQIGQGKLVLVSGKTYVLTFRAKADATRTISVNSQISGGDWHGIGLSQEVPLTTAWQPSKITFTAVNVTDNAQLVFNVGQVNGTVWLADATLTQTSDASTASVPTQALKVNVTSKGNGAFDVQTISKPFALVKDKSYTLSYMARSDAPRKAFMSTRINGGDYHSVSDADPNVVFGTTWHSYSTTFKATSPASDATNVVALSVGDQAGAIWIANVKLYAATVSAQ